jgi:hypothetical protein
MLVYLYGGFPVQPIVARLHQTTGVQFGGKWKKAFELQEKRKFGQVPFFFEQTVPMFGPLGGPPVEKTFVCIVYGRMGKELNRQFDRTTRDLDKAHKLLRDLDEQPDSELKQEALKKVNARIDGLNKELNEIKDTIRELDGKDPQELIDERNAAKRKRRKLNIDS